MEDRNPFYGLEGLVPWLKDLYAFERQQDEIMRPKNDYEMSYGKHQPKYYDLSHRQAPRQMMKNK